MQDRKRSPAQFVLIDSYIEDTDQESTLHGKFIPYGLNFLYKALELAGYQGRLVLQPEDYRQLLSMPKNESASIKMIGISAATLTRFDAVNKIKACRAAFPDTLIVAGGHHFGNSAEDALLQIPELDVVVRGEGDEVIVDLMEYAQTRTGLDAISGITHRDSHGRIISKGPKLIVDNLPDIRFLKGTYSREMFESNPLHPAMPIPAMNVLAGRGCPYNCIFCSVNRTKNRMYPVKDVVDLIEETVHQYGIKGVKFYDDSLTIHTNYVYDLCREIKKRNIEIYWFCDSRANIDLELLPEMYSAGCRFIAVGLETGSPKIQKIIKKSISNDMLVKFTRACKAAGISTYIFLMTSLPDETPEDLEMTVEMAKILSKECKAVAGSMGATAILPGSQIEGIARERGILPPDFSWYRPFHNPLNEQYEAPPMIPLYIEHITPEHYHDAKRRMLVNYADSLSAGRLIKNSIKNLIRRDLSFSEKFKIGWQVFSLKTNALIKKGK